MDIFPKGFNNSFKFLRGDYMLEKINKVRKSLDAMVERKDLVNEEVLKVSTELDTLIVEYYKDILGDRKYEGKLAER